jgi:hypothetical protein
MGPTLEETSEAPSGSAYDTIHNRLGFRKVCARWVPKELTEEQKNNLVAICQRLLDLLDTNSHWRRNVGPSFCTGKQTPEHGMETSGITSEEEIQESTFCGKSDAHNVLGLTRG